MSARHVIYNTLASRTVVGGVPREFLFLSLLVAMSMWVITGTMLVPPVVLAALWVSGFIYTKADPDFMSIVIVKRLSLTKTKTLGSHKGNRYLP